METDMNTEYLKNKLINKAVKEQENYIEDLKKMLADIILERAYEKVMRDDLIVAFEYAALSGKQLSALNELKYPVSACFDAWQKKDDTYMDRLIDAVDEYSEKLVNEKLITNSSKKKYEPER